MQQMPAGPRSIDMNADLGEGFANDRALLDLVTSASICCGAHAGARSCHPPDAPRRSRPRRVDRRPSRLSRPGWIRPPRATTLNPRSDRAHPLAGRHLDQPRGRGRCQRVLPQAARGTVQPGPAQSPMSPAPWSRPPRRSVGRCSASRAPFSRTPHRSSAWPYIAEGFPDRRYRSDGSLMPRSDPAAVLQDPHEIEEQVIALASEGRVASLCIHGDEPCARRQRHARPPGLDTARNRGALIRKWLRLMGLIVVNAGCCTTVQDAGRPGYAAWGVSAGGAFDRRSSAMANALLGNPPDCAVLEMTLVGGTYQADGPLALALAGAPMDARIVQTDAHSASPATTVELLLTARRQAAARPYDLRRSDLPCRQGWLANDAASWAADRPSNRCEPAHGFPAAGASVLSRHLAEPPWQAAAEQPFRILAGPDARSNPALDSSFWSQQHFRVGSRHDRKGLRLHGAAIGVASDPERLSTPVAPGAIQVAGGQLIVLGVACGTMGGYPHVAHVISADLDRLGQLKTGDAIQFELVTIEQARGLHKHTLQEWRSLIRRIELLAQDD